MRALDPGGDLAAQGIDLRLWRVDLDAAPLDDAPHETERQRAARFARPDDGRRYLASHAALRRLLGTRQTWVAGANGKPALAVPPPHFNLSRREGVALIGISATHEIGVDVEPLQAMTDANELAQLHFTPRSCATSSRSRGARPRVSALLDTQGSLHEGHRPRPIAGAVDVRVRCERSACACADRCVAGRVDAAGSFACGAEQ
jgi:4'-phosphopantetheinyl transferase EntD